MSEQSTKVPNDKAVLSHVDCDYKNNNFSENSENSSHSVTSSDNGVAVEQKQVLSTESSYQCPKCTKNFKRGDHLKRHFLSVHDQDLPYYCGDCPKAFASTAFLLKHCETSHFGVSKKGPFCGWCGSKFWSVKDLEKHAEVMHQKQDADYMSFINKTCKVYGCSFCQKTVSNEKILRRHIEKMHSTHNGKLHVCLKCFSTFQSARQLEDHYKDCRRNNDVSKDKQRLTTGSGHRVPSANVKSYQYKNNNQPPHVSTVLQNHQFTESNKMPSSFRNCFSPSLSTPNTVQQKPLLSLPVPSDCSYYDTASKNPRETEPVLLRYQHVSDDLPEESITKNHNGFVHQSDTKTVSEALSLAMKALSDFSYEDLFCHSDDYVPSSFSVFQSTSPLANFHYPNTVLCSDLLENESSVGRSEFSSISSAFPSTSNSPNVSRATLSNGYNSYMPSPSHDILNQLPKTSGPSLHLQDARSLSTGTASNDLIQNDGIAPNMNTDSSEWNECVSKSMIQKTGGDSENPTFTCIACNKVFEGVDNVMHHLETVHLTSNSPECCLCKKRFAQAGNVKRHIRFVHLRERPFQCSECDSTFDRLCYLQRHMRSHVDSNGTSNHFLPSNCPECGKQCLTRDHLRGHMLRRHLAKNKEASEELMKKYEHIFSSDKFSIQASPASVNHVKTAEVDNQVELPNSNQIVKTPDQPSKSVQTEIRKRAVLNKSSKVNVDARPRLRQAQKKPRSSWSYLPFKCRFCFGRRFPKLSLLRSHVAFTHHRNRLR